MPKPLLQCKPIPVIGRSIQPSISSIVHQPGIFIATRRLFLNISYPPIPSHPIELCLHTPFDTFSSHAYMPLLPIINGQRPPLAFNHRPSIASPSPAPLGSGVTDYPNGATGWHGVRTDRLRLTPVDAFNEQLVFGFRKRLHFIKHLPEQLIYMTLRCFHIPSRGYYHFQLSIAYGYVSILEICSGC